jgi:hypothetical protein
MDEEVKSVETQEVAETVETVEQPVEQPVETVESEEKVEIADQPKRDFEKDAAYAQMRREKEAAEKKARELVNAVKLYGFKGDDPLELADEAKAQFLSKSVEEIRAERQKEEELELAREQIKAYEKEKAEKMYESDLKEIQAIDPSIKTLDELGKEFINLRFGAKLGATEAYKAIRAIKPKIELPKEIGKINTTGIEKEYYTLAEIDKLSKQDLRDPKKYEKAMKSLRYWKK